MSDPDTARLRWVEKEADDAEEPDQDGPDTLDWEDR